MSMPPDPPMSQDMPDDVALQANPELELQAEPESQPDLTIQPDLIIEPETAQRDDVPLQMPPVQIPVAEPAPLSVPERNDQMLGLPLQLVNQLLARLGSTQLATLADLMPALRVLGLLLLAGFVLKLTGATLGALNEIPMLGRLLELVGLISALNFLARNALRSQKRAELLARIQKLKREFLG